MRVRVYEAKVGFKINNAPVNRYSNDTANWNQNLELLPFQKVNASDKTTIPLAKIKKPKAITETKVVKFARLMAILPRISKTTPHMKNKKRFSLRSTFSRLENRPEEFAIFSR